MGDAVDDAVGDSGGGAALEPRVVLDRDAGEEGGFFASQALDPPTATPVDGQPGLLGGDPGSPCGEELPDLPANVSTDVVVVLAGACHGFTQENLPRRWVAGADAVATVEQKAQTLLVEADAYRELSSHLAQDDA